MAAGITSRQDLYANIMAQEVVESAANTITSAEVRMAISIGERIGMLIDQIDYFVTEASLAVWGDRDTILAALSTRSDLTSLTTAFNERSVIHLFQLTHKISTSGRTDLLMPFQHQFFPPLITVPNRGSLYLYVQGISMGQAITIQARVYFRYVDLTDATFLELAEAFELVG